MSPVSSEPCPRLGAANPSSGELRELQITACESAAKGAIVNKALLVWLATLALTAHAQVINTFDGTWVVQWTTVRGRPASATLELRDGAGTWKTRVLEKTENSCVKVAALAKVGTNEGENYLSIEPSAVISGCPNSSMKLTRSDGGNPKGSWRDGRDVTFTKE
jgi:hypothetical protein